MSNLDELLDQLEAEAGSNFELDNYEEMESFEVENFFRRQGMDAFRARQAARQVVRNPASLMAIRREMAANGGQGKVYTGVNPAARVVKGGAGKSAALFNIIIKRESVNIPGGVLLPVPVLGFTPSVTGYKFLIDQEMPSGVSLLSMSMGSKGIGVVPDVSDVNSAVFRYQDSLGNIDSVRVSCNEVPYPYFVESLGTNDFSLSKMRLSLSDKTQLSQFNNPLVIAEKSMFGKSNSDGITPTQFNDPKNFKDGIIDIDGSFEFDKNKALITKMIGVLGLEVTLSAFVKVYFKN